MKDSVDQLVAQFRPLSVMSSFGLMALSPATIPNRGFSDGAYKQYQTVLATTDYFNVAIAESTAFYAGSPVAKIAGLGDLPLVVLSHGIPDESSEADDAQESQFEQEWAKMQKDLTGLSSNSEQIIAKKSGHYIQLEQPELVIDALLKLIQEIQ